MHACRRAFFLSCTHSVQCATRRGSIPLEVKPSTLYSPGKYQVNPFRTAVLVWRQTTYKLTGLCPKQQCGTSRVRFKIVPRWKGAPEQFWGKKDNKWGQIHHAGNQNKLQRVEIIFVRNETICFSFLFSFDYLILARTPCLRLNKMECEMEEWFSVHQSQAYPLAYTGK